MIDLTINEIGMLAKARNVSGYENTFMQQLENLFATPSTLKIKPALTT